MNDNHIEIKEKRSSLVAKGIIFLFLSVFSLSIALLPYIINEFQNNSSAFYFGGGIAFCVFATMFVYLLFKECNPDSLLILNSHGFTDKKNIGANIEIEWTNIASVKLMGKKETPYLGITIENADLIMVHMKKPYVDDMRINIEEGLPHIIISQKEIRYPITELKDLFVKFTREARALKNDVPVKPKNNPFTTEDVLRAFGKLEPKQEDDEPDTIIPTESVDTTNADLIENANESETDLSAKTENEANEKTNELKSVESFYEMLIKQSESTLDKIDHAQNESINNSSEIQDILSKPTAPQEPDEETASENNAHDDSEDNELSNEINELISKAKSSKISEIEKILNEKDIPFSVSKGAEEPFVIKFDPPSKAEESELDVLIPGNDADENDFSIDSNKSNMNDTKEFYPDVIHFDDI